MKWFTFIHLKIGYKTQGFPILRAGPKLQHEDNPVPVRPDGLSKKCHRFSKIAQKLQRQILLEKIMDFISRPRGDNRPIGLSFVCCLYLSLNEFPLNRLVMY